MMDPKIAWVVCSPWPIIGSECSFQAHDVLVVMYLVIMNAYARILKLPSSSIHK